MGARRIQGQGALLALALSLGLAVSAAPVKPPKNPAKITIEVAPEVLSPGGEAEVTLRIDPIEGVKIARYPQIKLVVKAQDGFVGEARATVGSAKPPPPDKLDTNYWGEVDPVVMTLTLDDDATPGTHEIDGKLTYYFCVSGNYCAPARVPVKIPLGVQ